MEAHALCSILIGHLSSPQSSAPILTEAAEQALESTWEVGRDAWPGVLVPAPLFVQHLAERSSEPADEAALLAALSSVHAGDLYLACACAYGLGDSVRRFDQEFIGRVPAFVSKLRLQPSFVEDVQQELRKRLLVRDDARPPGIVAYEGRGRLVNWIAAVAVRTAISMGRSTDERNERVGDIAERVAGITADPAIESMKQRYGVLFKEVLQQVIADLPGEQRNLLRHYYVEGFTTTQIGALFNLNQSSASRRLSSIRERILSESKRILRAHLKLSDSEFAELAGLVQSQLNLSLSRVLGQVPK